MSWSKLCRRVAAGTRDDGGSILILAILIVIGVTVVLAATLSFAQTGLNTSVQYRYQRNILNYADGVLGNAINALRGSPKQGVGSTCDLPSGIGTTTNLSADDWDAASHTYTVSCQPLPGSGGFPDNQPSNAILTLGTAAGEGLDYSGNETMQVDGSVYVNGDLTFDTSSSTNLLVNGDLTAKSCELSTPPHLVVRGTQNCSSSTNATDPNYAAEVDVTQPIATVMSAADGANWVDPTPTCASAGSVVVFEAGLYTEFPDAPSGCNGTVWWFQPGVYYFDFNAQWAPASNIQITAGTANGFTASTSAGSVSIPGACVQPNPTDGSTPPGAQIIFGGDSAISLAPTNAFEVCSNTYTNKQEIAIYGLNAGTRQSVSGDTLKPSAADTSGTAGASFLPIAPATTLADALGDIDTTKLAAVALTPASKASATTSAYATIPSGSTVTSVKVQIAHFESDPKVAVSGTMTMGSNTFPLGNVVDDCSTLCTQTVDVTSHLPNKLPYQVLDGTKALSVTFAADGKDLKVPTATSTLDGINIIVDYTKPGFEATCPASGAGACAEPLLENHPQGSNQNMFFHGSVYTPLSALNVTVQNKGTTIFDRGVICETLTVDASASSKQLTPPFSLPMSTTGRKVLFTVSVDGVPKVRAVANYQDYAPDPTSNTGKIAVPGFAVTVTNWSVLR